MTPTEVFLSNERFVVANVGDSRAVVSKGGKADLSPMAVIL